MIKYAAIAIAISGLTGVAYAQVTDPPAKVPTGIDVRGPVCLVEVGNQTYRPANCNPTDARVDLDLLNASLNNQPVLQGRVLWQGGGDGSSQ